jgi:hypothetical protein
MVIISIQGDGVHLQPPSRLMTPVLGIFPTGVRKNKTPPGKT